MKEFTQVFSGWNRWGMNPGGPNSRWMDRPQESLWLLACVPRQSTCNSCLHSFDLYPPYHLPYSCIGRFPHSRTRQKLASAYAASFTWGYQSVRAGKILQGKRKKTQREGDIAHWPLHRFIRSRRPTPLLAPSLVLFPARSAEAAHVGCLFQSLICSSTHHSFTVTFFSLDSRLFDKEANASLRRELDGKERLRKNMMQAIRWELFARQLIDSPRCPLMFICLFATE